MAAIGGLMTRLIDLLYHLLLPLMRPWSVWLLAPQRRYYTWVYEFLVAGFLLAIVTILTTDWFSAKSVVISLASAAGVFFSFGHAKVASRMMEAQAQQTVPSVPCFEMAEKYWVSKEIAWFIALMASGMYPALFGNFLFLIYPAWRRIHVETRKAIRQERSFA